MIIQIASDLHLEFAQNRKYLYENPIIPNTPKGDILILAGDIIPLHKVHEISPFFNLWEKQFKSVFWVPGNHEFYNNSIDLTKPSYEKRYFEKTELLQNRRKDVIFNGTSKNTVKEGIFIFSTLWSNIPPDRAGLIQRRISDYHVISISNEETGKNNRINQYTKREMFTVEQSNELFRQSLQFLEHSLDKIKKDSKDNSGLVVVTHHLPVLQCIYPKWRGSDLWNAFASDLDYLVRKHPVDLWIFGHQHEPMDFTYADTRFVSNPLGYASEGFSTFQQDFCIEL